MNIISYHRISIYCIKTIDLDKITSFLSFWHFWHFFCHKPVFDETVADGRYQWYIPKCQKLPALNITLKEQPKRRSQTMTTINIAVYCKQNIANKMINPGQKQKMIITLFYNSKSWKKISKRIRLRVGIFGGYFEILIINDFM